MCTPGTASRSEAPRVAEPVSFDPRCAVLHALRKSLVPPREFQSGLHSQQRGRHYTHTI